ncbi:MAG: homoserine kinase [Acidobacteria bacterium]|nr:homoserine kinase [Acidobacteriota bacterium]MCA1639716.1 homoserine kinase [Acidobacteriota bacterium]
MSEISILSPATVANVVCGFDCLGFALSAPCDEMTVRIIEKKTVRIVNRDQFNLPTEPEKNVAGAALLSMLKAIDENFGFEVEITKHIKPGSGIGSSAASAAGAVVAANELLDERFSKLELIEFAMDGEKVASDDRHADNVAPCIFGGFTLVRSLAPLDVVTLNFPPLFVTVIHPQIEIKTSEARRMLPLQVSLKDAIRQWSNVGALVSGLQKGNYELISRSLEDFIVETVRKSLIPKFDAIKNKSLKAGALGGGISGSGPSVFMLSETSVTARKVENVMREIYSETAIDFNIYVTKINAEGIKILEK